MFTYKHIHTRAQHMYSDKGLKSPVLMVLLVLRKSFAWPLDLSNGPQWRPVKKTTAARHILTEIPRQPCQELDRDSLTTRTWSNGERSGSETRQLHPADGYKAGHGVGHHDRQDTWQSTGRDWRQCFLLKFLLKKCYKYRVGSTKSSAGWLVGWRRSGPNV